MTDLSLTQAAGKLGWSRKSLVRRLAQHGIPTYGSGRLERITPANLELLKEKEQRCRTSSSHPASAGRAGMYGGTDSSGEFEYSTQQSVHRLAEKWVEEVLLPRRASRRIPGAGEAVGFATAARLYIAAKLHLSKQDIRKVEAVAAEIGEVDCLTHAHLAPRPSS